MRSGALAGLLVLAAAGDSRASAGFENRLPNGTCAACHAGNPSRGNVTTFGNLFRVGTVKWNDGTTCTADTDGDGQKNGEELGDPCCVWNTFVFPDRTSDISNPSDANSKSTMPKEPSCIRPDMAGVPRDMAGGNRDSGTGTGGTDGGTGGTDPGGGSSTGCSTALGAGGYGGGTFAALLGAFGVLTLLRRRRRA